MGRSFCPLGLAEWDWELLKMAVEAEEPLKSGVEAEELLKVAGCWGRHHLKAAVSGLSAGRRESEHQELGRSRQWPHKRE